MKRIVLVLGVGLLIAGTGAFSNFQQPRPNENLQIKEENRNPWTHLRLNNKSQNFQFAIVSDRTGGHRPQIFSRAVKKNNLLQPEFVISVGDLIEGYTDNKKQVQKEWLEFQTYVNELHMPFFYVPGNHDYTNDMMAKEWKERFGRDYYHFVYRDVLFLMLNSEDPPGTRRGMISKDQLGFVRNTLKANANVRWTILFLHKPLWNYGDPNKNGWIEVEKALGNRKYTVFAGHLHNYKKFKRNGREYYQLATTGGVSRLRGIEHGEFDHIVWVTMKEDGPVLANILLPAILHNNLEVPITDEKGFSYETRETHPVRGKVFFQGCPATNAVVEFRIQEPGKRIFWWGDGVVRPDGSFVLSTFKANDGAPEGRYKVVITCQNPHRVKDGNRLNILPERYASVETTPLEVEVTKGPNEFVFHLKR